MTDIRLVLADNMKKYRKIQKISQEKLAEKVNTAPNYIAMIEVGKKFPSASMLERIAMALNVDTPELFTTDTVKFMPNANKTVELLYQEVLFDFRKFENDYKQFEKSITEKIKQWQQG
ncbi:MAG: helix-turn-helix transcriptional regulator [Treponema sp.]|jgi:transcriptional regulator with XRE-family HTH domain|nr:helix-turn-helix transcriptional regulator [Treponema sp.]